MNFKIETMDSLRRRQQRSMTAEMSINVMRQQLLTVENLRDRAHRVLKCIINLHIEFLVLESHVAQLLDDVKNLNADLTEVKRLDALIDTLRDYNGPTICHEWPYPLIFKGTVDNAEMAQILNTSKSERNGNIGDGET